MSDQSAIEWTDTTWNPTTGCTKVSPGCAHCYIERTPPFRTKGRRFVDGATDLQLHAVRLEQPLHWRKPRRVFVNSLSDLFHDAIPCTFLLSVFSMMQRCPQHTFQILTKRAESMRDKVRWLGRKFEDEGEAFPLPNVWLGVSVENQHFADERIPLLLQTPAAVRFISAEPLLGPVKVHPWLGYKSLGVKTPSDSLDWVIVGGESGPGSRPFDLAWARSIVEQCQASGVPVFVKQLGANCNYRRSRTELAAGAGVECEHGYDVCPECDAGTVPLRDKKGGDITEWPEDLRIRQFPGRW